MEELWVPRYLMAGLGCLCSDYILQWPWLLISGTFRAPQQGAKQHEQTPLDGKGGRKHIEVDTHRNCSGAQRAYVFVGHSRVPRNKRLEPQQGAALCYLILDSCWIYSTRPFSDCVLGAGEQHTVRHQRLPSPRASIRKRINTEHRI